MTASHRLPVRPTIRPGEDLAHFLTRCAVANGITMRDLTGHPLAARVWEDPPDSLVEHMARLTATPSTRLKLGTVRGQYPRAKLTRPRTGSRYLSSAPICPTCSITPAVGRLNITVLCPNCESLLVDDSFPTPPARPPTLTAVHAEVVEVLRSAESSHTQSARMARLEALIRAQEPALWEDSPPLVKGETPGWRSSAVALAQQHSETDGKGPRPPSLNAALLLLCWSVSASEELTQNRLAHCAITSDPSACHPPLSFERQPDRDTALTELREAIRRHGIKKEHIPNALHHRSDPRVLMDRVLPHRSAQALALMMVVSNPSFLLWLDTTACDAAKALGHAVAPAVSEAAKTLLLWPESLQQLTSQVHELAENGLADLDARRRELTRVTRLPQSVLRSLPATASAHPDASSLAAAWVWLDATQGRLSGGSQRYMSPVRVRDFDADLNAEGRLQLREWWQQRLHDAQFDQSDTRAANEGIKHNWAV